MDNLGQISVHDFTYLTRLAIEASQRAYCPYSKFPVGAALIAANEAIFAGCNVENASFGLTICAERNAVFNMVQAIGRCQIVALVIYTPTETPSASCGACRQVINEFNPNAAIFSLCKGDDRLAMFLEEMLPHAFGPHNLIHPQLAQ